MKGLAALTCGALIAILGAALGAIMFGANAQHSGVAALVGFIAGSATTGFIALKTARAASLWRRLLILAALLAFMLPLAGLVFTETMVAQQTATGSDVHGATVTMGTAVGGMLFSGMLGLIGLFCGLIFLVVGLLVGRAPRVPH